LDNNTSAVRLISMLSQISLFFETKLIEMEKRASSLSIVANVVCIPFSLCRFKIRKIPCGRMVENGLKRGVPGSVASSGFWLFIRHLNLILEMRHLAVYLMLVIGGNASPTAEDVTNALSQCGIEVDEERLNTLITELEGKDLAQLIEEGKDKLVVGGGVAAAAAPAAGGAAPAAAAAAAPAPKPKEEEVDALEGGMDMFGAPAGGGDY
jgi:large subunit ribosomal protein LP2